MRLRALAVAAAATLATVTAPAAVAGAQPAAPDGKDVIVQLFQWNWDSVARECTDVLGPKGYGAVQVSPPQEHVVLPAAGHPWWQDYQPVSYRLGTRRGDRQAFESMVDTCHAAGVKVYADAVINHMTGQNSSGTGSAGSQYSHYEYPGLYGYDDFHHCGRNGDDDIENYQDRYEVQNCELVNLADLATGSTRVQERIAGYLDDLLALGVDGFRIDAAKHMPAADIAAIKAELTEPAYLYQEVIHGAGEPITPEEYTGNGDVTEFRYGRDLAKIFDHEKLAYLRTFASVLPSEQAVVFTDNHDTQRHSDVLTHQDGRTHELANAFMLAWTYGTPRVMSSYTFSDPDAGPPADSSGITEDTDCSSAAWQCEHRQPRIANMVEFHNVVQGTSVNRWWDNGNDAIAFGRGDRGYLVLNGENSALTGRSFHTSLPAGTYCDVFHGEVTGTGCTGPTYTVDDNGWFRADIAAQDGVALHIGAKVS
ncbi:alpha-amylase [Haloactinomyces albus]|uniref:Alpha-amylase n=1 Tax=Haloactinomyces albus TaxID=1352928 RepID=A0AAE4CRK7_9ACTN|nr:alpha-amylase family protein [Haloactinomyces albus]MDR7303808.1 alpha-amylase [Haloactinomyces albus]